MTLRTGVLFILASVPVLADLNGRWSAGGDNIFVLHQNGDAVTGLIEGRPGQPTWKIVDGLIRGNEIHFFVLHEDENDPEVKANGGNPFHNLATGTFTENEIVVSGSRENTKIHEYRLVLKRIGNQGAGANPIVTISTGQLRGSLTADGGTVFKNIPFAQPPVGELRWREPLPAKAWTGVRDATAFGPMCNQNDNKQLPHSEDCLQLNVWTPKSPVTSPAPVMVWIHGGGNVAGSGVEALFNGEALARHGVVVVTVNYRLGVLGFFAHPALTKESPYHASGNYGLADQILALQWVRENIAKFGGNPANVTIFGESAGASDVNALIASPLTKGLFANVIAQSGPVGAQASLADSEKRGVDFAAKLGLTGNDALPNLRALSDAQLMEKGAEGAMGITVDGWVLPEAAAKIYSEGRQQKVALLIGNNSQEMQPRGAPTDIRQLISQRYGPLTDRAKALYGVSGASEPEPDPESGTVLMQFTTDNSFRCGTVQELIWHTAAGNSGYQYQFSRTVHGKEALGAPHASEIPFIFGTLSVWQQMRNYNDSDQQYAPQMQEYWTNFARTGDPNGAKLVKWPKFDPAKRAYLDFTDAGPLAKEGLRREVCDLFIENQKRQAR